jgi:hypothetical protein
MISYIITFLVGSYLGVAFMCLFQINKKFTGSSPDISSTLVAGRTEVLDMVEERKILAKRVNELCKERGLTYEELSFNSEVPLDIVLQMADASVKNPGIFVISKICKGLDVSLRYFFDTEEFRNVML